jgi:hypothetical protein
VGIIPVSGTENSRDGGEIGPLRPLSQQVFLSTDYSTAQNEEFFQNSTFSGCYNPPFGCYIDLSGPFTSSLIFA